MDGPTPARPMRGARILGVTLGTRGDVAPFVHLGAHLEAEGHRFTLAAQDGFADLAARHQLGFVSIGEEFSNLLDDPLLARLARGGGRGLLSAPSAMRKVGDEVITTPLSRVHEAAADADIILCQMFTSFALSVAEAHGLPAILLAMQPVSPTGRHALPIFRRASYGRMINRLTHQAPRLASAIYGGRIDRYRRAHGLARLGRLAHPFEPKREGYRVVNAYSSALAPRADDWAARVSMAGQISTPPEPLWTPPPGIARFLEKEPPVYIGFGSLPCVDRRAAKAVVEGVRLWGGRALLARRIARLAPKPLPPGVRQIGLAPHDQLFQRVAAVVHHGGAGTTQTGLAAGRPTFIAPIIADNHFWASRVVAAGAGPPPIDLSALKAESFAEILSDLTTNPAYQKNAAALGDKIRDERGEVEISRRIAELLAADAPAAGG